MIMEVEDIELVIKIPEWQYRTIKEIEMGISTGIIIDVLDIIRQGTPLPKGHGDLVEKKEIIERYKGDYGRRIYADEFIHDIEVNVPTIIEADREQEDGTNK